MKSFEQSHPTWRLRTIQVANVYSLWVFVNRCLFTPKMLSNVQHTTAWIDDDLCCITTKCVLLRSRSSRWTMHFYRYNLLQFPQLSPCDHSTGESMGDRSTFRRNCETFFAFFCDRRTIRFRPRHHEMSRCPADFFSIIVLHKSFTKYYDGSTRCSLMKALSTDEAAPRKQLYERCVQ